MFHRRFHFLAVIFSFQYPCGKLFHVVEKIIYANEQFEL
jgi:hypothetical protein